MCWQLFEILLSSSTPFFLREFITSAEGSEGNPALVNVASPLSCLKKKIIALSSSLSASTETKEAGLPSPRLAVVICYSERISQQASTKPRVIHSEAKSLMKQGRVHRKKICPRKSRFITSVNASQSFSSDGTQKRCAL